MGEADKVDLEEFREMFEAVTRGDWTGAQVLFHPDIAWHDPPELPDSSVHVGREAIVHFWQEELSDAWESWSVDLGEVIRFGDVLLTTCRLISKAKHTGIETDIELFQVWRFKNGLIVEQRAFLEREQALAAAGVTSSEG